MRHLALASLCSLLGLADAGCGVLARIGVGPCVDTDGNPGFDVTLTWGLGYGDSGRAIVATGTMGGGMSGEPFTGSLLTGLSAELIATNGDVFIALQGGLLFSTRTLFHEENEGHFDFGGNVGFAWVFASEQHERSWLTHSRRTNAFMLGRLAQGEVLWVHGEAIGYFTFPLFFEFLATT